MLKITRQTIRFTQLTRIKFHYSTTIQNLPIIRKTDAPAIDRQAIQTSDGSWKSSLLKDDQPITPRYEDAPMTTYEAIRHGRKIGGTDMLGKRVKENDQLVWKWISYDQGIETADHIAQALRKIGAPVGDQYRIGIFSKNRAEWALTDLACHSFSNVSVPFYDTVTRDDMCYILNLSDIEIMFVDTKDHTKNLLTEKNSGKIAGLKNIIQFDEVDPILAKEAESSSIRLWSYQEMIEMGKKIPKDQRLPHVPPSPDTIATISFTSGTTGRPKGVILTHQNLCCAISISRGMDLRGPGVDSHLSYLPMGHIFERCSLLGSLFCGMRVGVFRGEPQHLIDDAKSLAPTFMVVVPRVIDRIHKAVMAQVRDQPLKKWMLKAAIGYKLKHYEMTGKSTRSTWADRLILAKVQEILGPNLRHMSVAAAKTDENVMHFMRGAFGIDVIEGYGQTETGMVTCQVFGDATVGNAGSPTPYCQVKILDVPELGYAANQNGGEICVKGYSVMKGYFKNPESTARTFTEDGYLRTGDIGRFDSRGTLEIVDRIKNVFKLPQGKFVAPEKIESMYTVSRFVQQIYVHGDMGKRWLVAVVVPEPLHLASYAKHKFGIEGKSYEELCKDERLSKSVLKHLVALTIGHNMPRYEGVYAVHLTPKPFSIENGLTTPTLKNKRPQLAAHFKKEIDEMFKKLEASELTE